MARRWACFASAILRRDFRLLISFFARRSIGPRATRQAARHVKAKRDALSQSLAASHRPGAQGPGASKGPPRSAARRKGGAAQNQGMTRGNGGGGRGGGAVGKRPRSPPLLPSRSATPCSYPAPAPLPPRPPPP
eukprot:621100-Pyramimonas_sp.AAC.1